MTPDRLKERWAVCPDCGGNTRTRVREDSVLFHHLMYCPRCKKNFLVNIRQFQTEVVREAEVQTRG